MKKVRIIGIPIDLGADRRGVDMGPSAIRYAGLQTKLRQLGIEVEDEGNIEVPVAESKTVYDSRAKYLPEIAAACELLASRVQLAMETGYLPVVLGGDHSVAIGSVAGAAKVKQNMGLIWLDAHGDFNTPETSSSGNIHGMPLAVSLGKGAKSLVNCAGFTHKVKPEHTVLIGIRDLDIEEAQLIKESKITVFTMTEIDQLGMEEVIKRAIKIAGNGTAGVHVSIDLDVVDPAEAPGVGTPVIGGITYRETHLAMEMLAESGIVSSVDICEVNPILDYRNKTAQLAVGVICSILGMRIL